MTQDINIKRSLMCRDDEHWEKVCKSGMVRIGESEGKMMIWIKSKKAPQTIHFKHVVLQYETAGFATNDENLWCRWKVKDDLIQGHQDFWCHVVFKTKDEFDKFTEAFCSASKSASHE